MLGEPMTVTAAEAQVDRMLALAQRMPTSPPALLKLPLMLTAPPWT